MIKCNWQRVLGLYCQRTVKTSCGSLLQPDYSNGENFQEFLVKHNRCPICKKNVKLEK